MNINVINQTSYKQIGIVYDNNKIILERNESILIDVSSDELKVEVLMFEKNKVLLNLFFAFIDGFIDGESVINSLYCNAMFKVSVQQTSTTIVLKDLEYRDDKNGYIYESVYIDSDDIKSIAYSLTNTDKTRKKALCSYVFLTSWLAVIIILLGYYLLFKGNILAIIASVIIFLVFTVPSWRKAMNTKVFYSSKYANEALLNQVHKEKEHLTNDIKDVPNDIFGKTIYKALDYFLKK